MWTMLRQMLAILDESAVWLLLGFGLAGIIHVVLSRWRRLGAAFAGRGPRPVVLATLVGLPMPLCSCSVLPAALALRREGAGRGAMASFLISVPETDIVSILITMGLLGPVMAVYRPLAALATALVAGLLVGALDRGSRAASPATATSPAPAATCCHERDAATARAEGSGPAPADGDHVPAPGTGAGPARTGACDHDAPAEGSILRDGGRGPWPVRALRYGYVRMFDDIVPQLVLGFLVAAALTTWLPGIESARAAAGSPFVYLVMLALGVPVYVCAVASTPMAVGLIAGGVSPGAALVFLLAGPATNVASLFVLRREFGDRLLAVYLWVLGAMSLAAGVLFDRLPGHPVDVAAAVARHTAREASALDRAATIAFLVLFAWSARRTRLPVRLVRRLAQRLCPGAAA